MNDSEQASEESTTNILEDEELTLREKLSSLTSDNQLWFNETYYNDWLRNNDAEIYQFTKFFQNNVFSDPRVFDIAYECWTDFGQPNGWLIEDTFFLNESPFDMTFEREGLDGAPTYTLSLDSGVLYFRQNSSYSGITENVYKTITPEQIELMNDWMSSLLPCDIPETGFSLAD